MFNFKNFDVGKFADALETRSPFLMRATSMKLLGFISPFNSHLKAHLKEWSSKEVRISMDCHRGVKNHVGSIHAGALFTLGETCAGLLIVRNFSFGEFRPLMTDINVKFTKQARGPIYGSCELSAPQLKKVKAALAKNEFPLLPMETFLFNEKDESIATVKTTWQIKPWKQISIK
jgi:acyl-coenzyme A thioesterase PaaI-like protein